MKHIFLVNPAAGKGKTLPALLQRITFSCEKLGVDYEIYHTTTVGDATRYAKKRCEESPNETLRFYACGGDGTMNEVANALACRKNAELAVVPTGTGNDFLRVFSHIENFSDMDKLILGKAIPMDIIKFGEEKYSLNILNIGFDCEVVKRVEEIKRASWVPHGMAYSIAVTQVITKLYGSDFTITTDDGKVYDGNHILVAFANAQYYGGGYRPAPTALVNDGLMHVCLFDRISRPMLMRLLPKYKAGTHLDGIENRPYLHYFSCKKATFEAPDMMTVCADGELSPAKKLEIEVVPLGINVVVPQGSKCTALVKKQKPSAENESKE